MLRVRRHPPHLSPGLRALDGFRPTGEGRGQITGLPGPRKGAGPLPADGPVVQGEWATLRVSYRRADRGPAPLRQRPAACRYLAGTLPDSVLPRIQEKLQTGPRPLAELAAPEAGLPLVALYTLLARRHLCFDWNAPLDIRATVSLPGQPYGGLHLADVLHSTRYGHLLAELALGRRPADQSVLAAAAAWRPRRRDLTPFNFVGGHGGQAPLRDLGQGECLPGTPWRRRDHAPGGATPQSGRGR